MHTATTLRSRASVAGAAWVRLCQHRHEHHNLCFHHRRHRHPRNHRRGPGHHRSLFAALRAHRRGLRTLTRSLSRPATCSLCGDDCTAKPMPQPSHGRAADAVTRAASGACACAALVLQRACTRAAFHFSVGACVHASRRACSVFRTCERCVVGKTLLHHRLPMCSTRVCDSQQFKVTDVPVKYHRGFQRAGATTPCRESRRSAPGRGSSNGLPVTNSTSSSPSPLQNDQSRSCHSGRRCSPRRLQRRWCAPRCSP